jgi:glycosyltransferase involved in cell wall biosynthesis
LTAEYDRASFLLVPSLVIENQPTVILEAFSRGTPVIGSTSGGIPEMVVEGETGFLFPPGDVDALVAAMQKALANDDWVKMSNAGRAWAEANGMQSHMQTLLAAYK